MEIYYEIGKYILDLNTNFIYFVEGSVPDKKYCGYAEALEAIGFVRDDDVKSGREAALLKENKVFLYFTAKWEGSTIHLFRHASWKHKKSVMKDIKKYDDRIIFI